MRLRGCLVSRTNIHWAVIALTSVATGATLLLLLYWFVLAVLIRCGKDERTKTYHKNVDKYTPSDILGWMAQAVREHHTGAETVNVKPKMPRSWKFGPSSNGEVAGIISAEDGQFIYTELVKFSQQ
jgi:hypothetical protein